MSNNNNSEEFYKTDNKTDTIEQKDKIETILIKGWNNFVGNIKDGFSKFQQTIEDQSKKNEELWNANKEKISNFFIDTRNNLDNTMKDWASEIEKIHTKNEKVWDKNREIINTFLKNTEEEWNSKYQMWLNELKTKQIETKTQLETSIKNIQEDIKNWQDATKKKWDKSLKSWRKELIKGSYLFLVFMIPILIVLFVIVALINWLFGRF